MEIISPNEFGKISLQALKDFEDANNVELPVDYRAFLLSFNGGAPAQIRVKTNDTIVSYIFGMHHGAPHASLYRQIDVYQHRVPLSTFPIAADPFGNLFIMSLHPDGFGHIYFWDHEGEPAHQDGHFTGNCTFIAYSFTEFCNELV